MITMNNSYNEHMHAGSSRMNVGFESNANKFCTSVFRSHSFSQPGCISLDIISRATPQSSSPSDSTSFPIPVNNQISTSTALTDYQSQSNTLYSFDSMFSSYKNFGRSDSFKSFGTNISTGLAQSSNSEPEVESSVGESRSGYVLIADSLNAYNSNHWIDNLTGKQKSNEVLLPAFNQTSHAKQALNLEPIDQEFTSDEATKIAANKKLAEMALADPKRVKRILANRQSAARSKEKKMRYVMELEHKVHKMQKDNSALSAQFTILQMCFFSGSRESMGLVNQNNELRIRLEALRQQSQLQNVLNEALSAEVQRLKLDAGELMHDLQ